VSGADEPGEEQPGAPPARRSWRRDSVVGSSLLLGAAVGVFGLSFGVLAAASGLSVAQACAMSLLVFTGASQFTAIAVIGSGGSPLAALGSALLLAARNGAYGVAVARFVPLRRHRWVAAQLVIDESTGMALAQQAPEDRTRAFWATGVAVFVFWNVATLLGAVGGSFIGEPETLGLDAAFPAGFVYLLAPHLRRMEGRVAAALGAAIALVLVPVAPAGVPVLAAALAALVGLRRPRPVEVRRA